MHLDRWWIFVSMPLIEATIGHVTKPAAIEMMLRPFLGWQGARGTPTGWRGRPCGS